MTATAAEAGSGLTLMAVHAHPDDEVLATGGILARYSGEGIRTVLVTCTNGEQGDASGGLKPGEAGHNPGEVAVTRLAELRQSATYLGVGHLEVLGYRDSGMVGWAANGDPGVFSNVPLAEVSGRLEGLLRRYQPQVVVTYDENGGYGHPDHIQVHRATVAAAESTGIPAKLYYSAVPRSAVARLRQELQAAGTEIEELEATDDFGVPDEAISAVVDVTAYVDRIQEALAAHASQVENFFFTRLPPATVVAALSYEYFTLRSAPDGFAREEDLFAGLR
jgi:LmbE family N-acetylglucosaminyl deacetylase